MELATKMDENRADEHADGQRNRERLQQRSPPKISSENHGNQRS